MTSFRFFPFNLSTGNLTPKTMKTSLPLIASVVITTLLGAATGVSAASGTTFTTATGGNWNSSSTWANGQVPNGGADVVILAGSSVTVTSSVPAHSITFSNNNASAAILTVNFGATLALGQGITLQNAAATNTSAVIQGGGAITCNGVTVGGTTTPTPKNSDCAATLTSTISNLTLSPPGNLSVNALYNSAQAAANQGVFALGGGTVSANGVAFTTVPFFGPVLTLATGAQNGTLTLSGPTPFTATGGGSSTFTPNGTNATVVYSGPGETVDAAVYQNLTLSGNGPKTLTGVTVDGILAMQGAATASVAPTYGSKAVLLYDGTGPQNTGPELVATLPNLSISNSAGVNLTSSTTVSNLLTLTSGKLTTGPNSLTVGTNGSIAGGNTSSYVNGNLQKNFSVGTQSFVYAIGDTEFAPLAVSNLSVTAAGTLSASTKAGAPPQMPGSDINGGQDVNRYWTLTNSGGTFGSYNATFNYTAADVKGGAVPAQFIVSVLSGTTWSIASVSGTPTTTATSISAESALGTFAIGDLAPAPATQLSITSINGGYAPQAGSPFSVTVQAQDSDGVPRAVTGATTVALSLHSGSGALGGTLTGTIPSGSNSVKIAGVTYSVAQSGVQLGAADTSGPPPLSSAVSAAFTVTPANQSITFNSPGNQTYGVAPITLTATASSGLPVSYSVTSGSATVSGSVLTITGAGSVTIQASQSGNANWNAANPVSQTISVAQKTVTGSFTANNKTYDGTATATVATTSLSGVINSDAVSLTVGAAAFSTKNAGNGKTVTASGLGLSGANAGNYVLASTSATNTANISPAALTVAANNQSRLYGTTNPVLTANYSGFVNGDNTNSLSGSPDISTTAVTNSPPGPYTIQVAAGSLGATNYSFTFNNGTLTVNGLPPVLTIQLVAGSTNTVIVSASGVTPGSTYQILGSTDLVNWAEIGTAQSAADGTLSFTNPAASPVQFYRTFGP